MESIWKMLTGRNFLNSWNELPRRCLWSFQSLPEGPTNELSNDRRDFLRLAAALPATAAGSWAMAQAPAVTPAAVAYGDIAPQDRVFITTNEDSNQHRRPAIARHWRRRRAGDAAPGAGARVAAADAPLRHRGSPDLSPHHLLRKRRHGDGLRIRPVGGTPAVPVRWRNRRSPPWPATC